MRFPTWSRSFYKPCSKKRVLNFSVPVPFQRYKNTSWYNTDCSPMLNYPLVNPHRFFLFVFSINQSFICKRNYLFLCPMNTWSLSNTRYQNILSMKPWQSNLQDRFFCDIGPYSLLFSVRKATCPRDQDGVLKISRLLHLWFTWNKG